MSITVTEFAPTVLAAAAHKQPIGPAPITQTFLPKRLPPQEDKPL